MLFSFRYTDNAPKSSDKFGKAFLQSASSEQFWNKVRSAESLLMAIFDPIEMEGGRTPSRVRDLTEVSYLFK